MLQITRVFFYSPIYLSIIRLMKISRVRNFMRLLEKQKSYKLFKDPNKKSRHARARQALDSINNPKVPKRPYLIKWTSTSD